MSNNCLHFDTTKHLHNQPRERLRRRPVARDGLRGDELRELGRGHEGGESRERMTYGHDALDDPDAGRAEQDHGGAALALLEPGVGP